MPDTLELQAIERRYERRRIAGHAGRYSMLDPYALMVDQEKDRALVRLLKRVGMAENISQRTLVEIGCGGGGNLLRFIRLGFRPENLVGNDLLEARLREARSLLPASLRLIPGDATQLESEEEQFDIVCLFTVFSSILDDAFQQRLADKAWSLIKPGGGVLWYDFVYNNPANPDVRGVPTRRLRELFPVSALRVKRVTLAPPVGRRVTKWWSGSYSLLNSLPVFRTHVLGWFPKRLKTYR